MHEADPSRGARLALLWILCISLALKLVLVAWVGDAMPDGDETQYIAAGKSLAAGNGIRYTIGRWDELHYPPLYPGFVGLMYALEWDLVGVKLIQVCLSTATVGLVFLLARRWFGDRVALVSAGLFAFDPTAVAFTHFVFSEVTFLFWLVLGFVLLTGRRELVATRSSFLFAGIALGLAALTREVVVYFLPIAIAWVYLVSRDLRGTVSRAAALAFGLVVTILPWTLHVHRQYGGGYFFISSARARALHSNYNVFPPPNYDWSFGPADKDPYVDHPGYHAYARGEDPVRAVELETQKALSFALDYPGICARHFGTRVVNFFNPTSFLIRQLRSGVYARDESGRQVREVPRAVEEGLVALTVASYLVLSILAVAGLWAMPASPGRNFALLLIAYTVLLHGATCSMSRYRLSILPVLVMAAAYPLVNASECARRLRSTRGLLAAATLLALCTMWALRIGKIWE